MFIYRFTYVYIDISMCHAMFSFVHLKAQSMVAEL